MRLAVNLVPPYDDDLIALYMNDNFDFSFWAERALVSYACGFKGFFIPAPPPGPEREEKCGSGQREICAPFSLDSGREDGAKALSWFSKFSPEECDLIVKHLMRVFLSEPCLAFLESAEMSEPGKFMGKSPQPDPAAGERICAAREEPESGNALLRGAETPAPKGTDAPDVDFDVFDAFCEMNL